MPKVVDFKPFLKEFGGDSVWEYIVWAYIEQLQKLLSWYIFWFCTIIWFNDFDWLRIARNPKLLPEIQFKPNYGTKPKYVPSMPSWSHAMLTDFSACMQTRQKHTRIQA